jgi:uncharacterized protein YndB with AHSA1/START domain
MRTVALTLGLALGGALPAAAGVGSASEKGFTVVETARIAATPAQVYELLIQPAKWWNPEHTFSRNAANLTLDARGGGCFCENAPDGTSVQHLVVVNVFPGKQLTLRGALGPFQSQAVEGVLTWSLKPSGDKTDLTLTYTVAGYLTLSGGFTQWSKAADAMLGEQVARLQKAAEGGAVH